MKPSLKKFIISMVARVIIFVVISIIVSTVLQSPVITNEVAMGQMENSNELYMVWEAYNNMMPVVNTVYSVIVVIFVGSFIYSIYKYIKSTKGEN